MKLCPTTYAGRELRRHNCHVTDTSTDSSVTEYVMEQELGAIAMLLSATGMGLVGTISRGTTAGLR